MHPNHYNRLAADARRQRTEQQRQELERQEQEQQGQQRFERIQEERRAREELARQQHEARQQQHEADRQAQWLEMERRKLTRQKVKLQEQAAREQQHDEVMMRALKEAAKEAKSRAKLAQERVEREEPEEQKQPCRVDSGTPAGSGPAEAVGMPLVCVICFDTVGTEAIVCDGAVAHRLCDDCLCGWCDTQTELRNGAPPFRGLRCPGKDCGALYGQRAVALHLPEDKFHNCVTAMATAAETRLSAQMEAVYEDKLAAELQRVAQSGQAVRLQQAQRHVIEKILTLSCPRCTQAFIDFEGCCALTCSRCAAAFCAFCLEDCGADAHRHVAACRHNPQKDVFMSRDGFKQAQCVRRTRMLRDYLCMLNRDECALVIKECTVELQDLNIDPAKCMPYHA